MSGQWVEERKMVRVREEKGLGLVFNMSRHGDRLAAVVYCGRPSKYPINKNITIWEGFYLMELGS